MDSSLDLLLSVLSPPRVVVGSINQNFSKYYDFDVQNNKVWESYKIFLSKFGGGFIKGPDIEVLSPSEEVGDIFNTKTRGKSLLEIYNNFAPNQLKAQVEDIQPIGSSSAGDSIYFFREKNGKSWKILILEEDCEEWEIHDMDLTSFLYLLLTKKLQSFLTKQVGDPPFEYIPALKK